MAKPGEIAAPQTSGTKDTAVQLRLQVQCSLRNVAYRTVVSLAAHRTLAQAGVQTRLPYHETATHSHAD